MGIFKKTETYVGAAALALVASLANCPDKVKSGPSFEVEEVKNRRVVTRTGVDEIFRSLDEEEEGEFTVHVPVDEDGNIKENFNFVGAVRDCVESTGLYHCSDIPRSTATRCYSIDEDNPVAPVDIVRKGFLNDETRKGKPNVSVGYNVFGIFKEGDDFDLEELTDADFTENQLNSACREAINLLERNVPFREICRPTCSPYDVVEREDEAEAMPLLDEFSAKLFEGAKEAGLEFEDKGGNSSSINLPEWNTLTHVEMDIVYDEEVGGRINVPTLIVTKPGGHEKTFYDPEEALNYLIELDLKTYKNEQ